MLCAQLGADGALASHDGLARGAGGGRRDRRRFGVALHGVAARSRGERAHARSPTPTSCWAWPPPGVQVMSDADRAAATRLLVAADINAVPPARHSRAWA